MTQDIKQTVERLRKDLERINWLGLSDNDSVDINVGEYKALIDSHDALVKEREWLPIETAPKETPVRIKVDDMEFTALLRPGFMDENENDVYGWVAKEDGQHPSCWTDGCCWQLNEDMNESLQPTKWKHITPPKEQNDDQ